MTANPSDPPDQTSSDNARDKPVTASLSVDEIYSLVADHHRRYTLYYLAFETSGENWTLDGLIEYLQPTLDEMSSRESSVRTHLYHMVLPRLQDAGVVDYDRRSEMIRYWGHPQLEEILVRVRQIEQGHEDPSQEGH
ncbi:DUF7344 domain-containing protein [Haladaptatus caseinilyticus]